MKENTQIPVSVGPLLIYMGRQDVRDHLWDGFAKAVEEFEEGGSEDEGATEENAEKLARAAMSIMEFVRQFPLDNNEMRPGLPSLTRSFYPE